MLLCVLLWSGPAFAGSVEEDDAASVQGRWQRLTKDSQGRTVRFEKEHRGRKTILTAFDEAGAVAYSHTSEFELSRSGKVRVFTYFNLVVAGTKPAGAEERRSYIYKVEGDRFFEVQGLLIGQEKDEPVFLVWDRMKK